MTPHTVAPATSATTDPVTVPSSSGPARIPFNHSHATGEECTNIRDAIQAGHLSGDGQFTQRCRTWLEERTGSAAALLVNSCTAALELGIRLADIGPGDEVIVPSYTFTSSANAIVVVGGTPVFVDIRPDTLNIDERLIERAITPKTKAIMPVHYAGVGAEMDSIMSLAGEYDIVVIEDAAQGLLSSYRDRALGSIGHIGAISFHETKNVTSGEGGVLLLNDDRFIERAEIIREKGTDRSRFFRGEVDKYSWVDLGSSYVLSELNAAYLWAQLQVADRITARRLEVWNRYHSAFEHLEAAGTIRRPVVPSGIEHPGHMYYILMPDEDGRDRTIRDLNARGINAVFHYVPLHSAPAGLRFGRAHGNMDVTDGCSSRLLRLPLWPDLGEEEIERVIDGVLDCVGN